MMLKSNGWLLLDKPSGISSAKSLSIIKRLYKPSKVGHAGTLDPFASGLLLVGIGEATKVMNFAVFSDKEYAFTITWGESRDTGDCDGITTSTSDLFPSEDDVSSCAQGFIGAQLQIPHKFSAVHLNGERAYNVARRGGDFELPPKQVNVLELSILKHSKFSTDFKIKCSKGFYIRSLARDMAFRLGVDGYVSALRRTKIGKFSVDDAISLEKAEKIMHNGQRDSAYNLLKSITEVLDDILVLRCRQGDVAGLLQGRSVSGIDTHLSDGSVVCVVSDEPIALCRVEAGVLYPIRVFNMK